MNESWTGHAVVTDLRWLAYGLGCTGLVLLTHAVLRLVRSRADQLVLPVASFLLILGLVNLYAWETRDANAYVSAVALPALREYQTTISNDPSLPNAVRAEIVDALGLVPNELDYETSSDRFATVLDPGWLRTYNEAARRFETMLLILRLTSTYAGESGESS